MEQLGPKPKISESDLKQILSWNGPAKDAIERCIHQLIEKQAFNHPGSIALQGWDGSYSFRKLEANALALASFLVTIGVGPGILVPLCFENSALNIVVMLAVLKAGGGYLSVDPKFPPNRIQSIISLSKAKLILSNDVHAPMLRGLIHSVTVIDVDFIEQLPSIHHEPAWPSADPTDPAYAIFTSGSTGTPKGIIIEHRSLSTMALVNGRKIGMNESSRVLQFATHTFDASIIEIFLTLVHGGCVCIPSEHEKMNHLAAYIARNGVNWAILTPTVASLLHPKDVSTLKYLALGGEAPREDLLSAWDSSTTLFNLYGPAECTVMAALCKMHTDVPLKTIGRGSTCRLWIVQQDDYFHLCPIGQVGELLIEGPIVGRGYIDDPERTAASFVDLPCWEAGESGASRIFYRTGDLVKYNHDGSIIFQGRRDEQVKIHGQRVEILDVESCIAALELVGQVSVFFIEHGNLEGKLVAVISLSNVSIACAKVSSDPHSLMNPKLVATAPGYLSALKVMASSQLPRYMLPTIWMAVEKIPLTTSKKIDRQNLKTWLEKFEADDLRQLLFTEVHDDNTIVIDAMEEHLLGFVGHVLNIDRDAITTSSSFFDLGGDSITAMQLVAKCRTVGLSLNVQEILKSNTLADLVRSLRWLGSGFAAREDSPDIAFNPTPVQQMYFEKLRSHDETGHCTPFTQFYVLRLSKRVALQDVEQSAKALVARHSILRARFARSDDGYWTQRTQSAIEGTYHFGAHEVGELSDIYAFCAQAHDSIDIIRGPVFGVDFFEIDRQEQLLFLVAHHTVIDLVSWRIIFKDLEVMLTSGTLSAKPLSFHSWARLQEVYASTNLHPQTALPYKITSARLDYWGMEDCLNVYGDQEGIVFDIRQNSLQDLFNSYRRSVRADPVDVLVASLLHSFNSVFADRDAPAVFSEGHGRESWDPHLDASETVGWFTTMHPIQIVQRVDFDQMVRLIKNQRESLPHKGWSYFTCRYLNENGRKEFAHHWPIEVNLNYVGHYQQLERCDALLQVTEFDPSKIIGPDIRLQNRLSLFEVTVTVVQGKFHFANVFNKRMRHHDRISEWMLSWKNLLVHTASHCQRMACNYTFRDFPLVPFSARGIQRINEIAQGLDNGCEIEDAYPCSPIQLGMLLAQARSSFAYKAKILFEVIPKSGSIEIANLEQACKRVIHYHDILRTLLVENVSDAPYDQIVLRGFEPKIEHVSVNNGALATVLDQAHGYVTRTTNLQYQFTICTSPEGKVFLALNISHALIDAYSVDILSRDVIAAYDGDLSPDVGPKYSCYIKYILEQKADESLTYWTSYLKDLSPTYFPSLNDGFHGSQRDNEIDIDLAKHLFSLKRFCKRHKVTASNVFLVAWGIVLRSLNSPDQVIFGYTTSGRDVPLQDIENAVGPYLNMLICRMKLDKEDRLLDLISRRRDEYLESLPYQHTSLAEIKHIIKLSQERMFNTCISFQRDSSISHRDRSISLHVLEAKDPSEVSHLQ